MSKYHLHFYNAWVQPFSHPVFGRFCAANLIYAFAASLLSLSYTFDLRDQPMDMMMGFFLAEYALLGFLTMPVLFYLHEKIDRKLWGWLVISLAAIPLVVLPFIPDNIIIKGMFYSLMLSCYWTVFHIFMTRNASAHNKGNDLSVALNSIGLGTLAGSGFATLLTLGEYPFVMTTMLGSTLFFCGILLINRFEAHAFTHGHNSQDSDNPMPVGKVFKMIRRHPRRFNNTVIAAFADIPTNAIWPLWLLVIGYDFTTVGIVAVVTVFLKMACSGIAGHLTNHIPDKALKYGALLLFAGWLPWLFTQEAVIIPFTILLWSIGNHFRAVGLTAQWYDAKSIPSLTGFEISQGIGRTAAILVCIPLLVLWPDVYPYIGAAGFFLMYLYNHHEGQQHPATPRN